MIREYDAVIPAPFGAVTICVHGEQLAIELLPEKLPAKSSGNNLVQMACQQISEYLAKPQSGFDLALKLSGTEFQQRVWRAIAEIPSGQTLTYSQLAAKVGSGPRAVANACGANTLPLVIPCHRVVARNGLGGFNQGRAEQSLAVKRWLLAHEKAA